MEAELKSVKEALQKSEHSLKLQEMALVEEHQAVIKLNTELEQVRKHGSDSKEAEERARKAERTAEKVEKDANHVMTRLKKQEEDLKKASEQKLATLLAEQRTTFDETLKAVRVELGSKMKILQDRNTQLERQIAQANAEMQAVQESTSPEGGTPSRKSKFPGIVAQLRFVGALAPERTYKKTVPREFVSYSEARVKARATKEAARAEVKAELNGHGRPNSPGESHGGSNSPGASSSSDRSPPQRRLSQSSPSSPAQR